MFITCWLGPGLILIFGSAIAVLVYAATSFEGKTGLIVSISIEAVALTAFLIIGIGNTKAYESKNGETDLTVISTRPREERDSRYPGDAYNNQYIVFAADKADNIYKLITSETLGIQLEKGSNITVSWTWSKARFVGSSAYLRSIKYNGHDYDIRSYGNKTGSEITICGTSTESIIPKEKNNEDNSILFG